MADVPPAPATPAAGTPAGADDPFQRLHKMSITAGLGSGDYVAISGLAVAAALLGVATALVLFHLPILLLIPVAGVVCAVLAFFQVAHSNGTLSGHGLALLGLVLSLGLGGYEAGQDVIGWHQARTDQARLIDLIRAFGADVAAERYAAAYARCDSDFRGYVSLSMFEATWRNVRHSPYLGTMIGLDWNGRLNFDVDPLTGQRVASGMVLVRFDRSPEPGRTDMFFADAPQGWVVTRIPQFFPPKSATPGKPQMLGPPRPS